MPPMSVARAFGYGLWDVLQGLVVLTLLALPVAVPVAVYWFWLR